MKKAGSVLVIISVMICIFTCGFLVGRNFNHNNISRIDINPVTLPSVSSDPLTNKVNINTASVDELTLLPGIGQTIAQRIVDYRTNVGHFRTASDLSNVEGIGKQKLLSILDYITI